MPSPRGTCGPSDTRFSPATSTRIRPARAAAGPLPTDTLGSPCGLPARGVRGLHQARGPGRAAIPRGLAPRRTRRPGRPAGRPCGDDPRQCHQAIVGDQVWALVELQRFTGAPAWRAGHHAECDMDASGRHVALSAGPSQDRASRERANHSHWSEGASVIEPFMKRTRRPICSARRRRSASGSTIATKPARTPAGQGNEPGTNRAEDPQRRPRDRYTTDSYRRAIERACDRAFPAADELRSGPENETPDARAVRLAQVKAWRKAHRWHPHQLRHSAATKIRKQFGLEAGAGHLGTFDREHDTTLRGAGSEHRLGRRQADRVTGCTS